MLVESEKRPALVRPLLLVCSLLGGAFDRAHKAEYKVVATTNANELAKELNAAATQGWKPILMSAGATIVVILEHVLGA
jgi:hypothetical protein